MTGTQLVPEMVAKTALLARPGGVETHTYREFLIVVHKQVSAELVTYVITQLIELCQRRTHLKRA